jgi:hypothetical protein
MKADYFLAFWAIFENGTQFMGNATLRLEPSEFCDTASIERALKDMVNETSTDRGTKVAAVTLVNWKAI